MGHVIAHPNFWDLALPGCSGGEQVFSCACFSCGLGSSGHLPRSMGGSTALPLPIFVWERAGSGGAIWRWLLGISPDFVAGRCNPDGYASGEVPTSANLNLYGGSGSRVRWHSDDEGLFGERGDPKLFASLSLGSSALFKWKSRSRPDRDERSCWLHHGDLLVMYGCSQDEYRHCTDSRLQGERVNVTSRWIKNHVPLCPLGLGVVCGLPACVKDSPVSTNAGLVWPGILVLACLVALLWWVLLLAAVLIS